MIEGSFSDGFDLRHACLSYWSDQREDNVLDGGSHYYGVYETRRKVRFYRLDRGVPRRITATHRLTRRLTEERNDQSGWPEKKDRMAEDQVENSRQWDAYVGKRCVLHLFSTCRPMSRSQRR